jgi:iron complex outermembrane recepter protein
VVHFIQNPKFTAKALLVGAASLAALAMSSAAHAQIEEIVVTANKVEENVQDVPIAITAISGERLAESGVASLENIGKLAPSVTFRKGNTAANSALFLRGVGTITFSAAVEPSVSTVVDGIVLSRNGQAFADLIDLERIEVLRGPQGTLFGKNASAGLVSLISKGGTEELEADLRAEYFEGDEYRLKGSISGPIAPDLSARLTGFYGSYDGNITNIFGGRNDTVNGYENYGARGILDYKGDGARVRFIADYFKANSDCCAETTGITRGAVLNAELGLPGVALGEEQRFINQDLISQGLDTQWSLTGSVDLDVFSDHTLSFVTGYRNWENSEIRDGDFLPRATSAGGQLHDRGTVRTQQTSAEIRLASDQSKAFVYQVGGFLFISNNQQDFTRTSVICPNSIEPIGTSGARPCNLADLVNTRVPTGTSRSDVDVTNWAFFGQATYNLTEQLSITAGLRYTRDSLSFTHFRAPGIDARTGLPLGGTANIAGVSPFGAGGNIAGTPVAGNGTNFSRGDTTTNNLSGKGSIQFKPTDDLLFYGSYTRGYKGPAFNVFFNHTAPNNTPAIDAEISDAFEAGIKSEFWDRKIQFNAAAFLATYDGFQANNSVEIAPTIFITNLTNAGTVRTKGFEVDAIVLPFEGLTLRGSVAYVDAKVRRFNPNPSTGAADVRNGQRLPLAPKWSYNVGADYETPIGESFKIYASTNYNYTGFQYSEIGQGGPLESYGIWNASLGVGDIDDKYRLTFHARNIGDTSYITLNTGAGLRTYIPRDADRYFGATLSAKIR